MVARTSPSPILFSLLACFLLLSSCQREPIYAPKKKISKIYYQYTSSSDSTLLLNQTWVWDKDLLKEIYIGESSGVMRFTYDKKRLTNIHYSTRESNMLYYFQYDKHNRQIISIDGYKSKWAWQSPEKEVHIDLHYNSDGLISGFEEEHFHVYYNKSSEKDKEATQTVLQLLCPELSFIKTLNVSKSKTSIGVNSASFEYKDGMLDAFQYIWSGINDTCFGKILSYTDIVNPFYNSCNILYIDPTYSITNKYFQHMPQHMIVMEKHSIIDPPVITEDLHFSYSTHDNYPIQISQNFKEYAENYPDTNYSNTTMVLEYLP